MSRLVQSPNNVCNTVPKAVITDFDFKRLRKMLLQYKNIIKFSDQHYYNILCEKLENASVVDSKQIPPDVVTMNSTFVLREKEGKEKNVYSLVFPEKSNVNENRISILSPLGCSVFGCSIQDEVEDRVPAGTLKLVLEKIIYQPERAGDYHL